MTTETNDRELVLERILDAPREKLYRGWTEAELIKQWFVPKPWMIADAAVDVRPGGSSSITMQSPEGEKFPNKGVYLEVLPNEKIVFTDAFTSAWQPSDKPFFVGTITFEDAGDGKTKYRAVARHWTKEDKESHEKMGFHEGWNQCATQLEELAKGL